jgi:hypothetical protein
VALCPGPESTTPTLDPSLRHSSFSTNPPDEPPLRRLSRPLTRNPHPEPLSGNFPPGTLPEPLISGH